MEIGYSLLLSSYVPATEMEYSDTEDFMIVCPNCKEPVFKKEMLVRNGEDISDLLIPEQEEEPLTDFDL